MLKVSRSIFSASLLLFGSFAVSTCFAQTRSSATADFSFFVAGDMRSFLGNAPVGKRYFDGACEAMKTAGPAAFLLSPGDCDPPAGVRQQIDRFLGTNFLWYPLVGNHDVEKSGKADWFRQWAESGIPHLAHTGPAGDNALTFSIDFGNPHLVLVDEYFNGHESASSHADVPDATLAWLEKDLASTHQPLIWVSGHKPIESLPDMDTGRVRHEGDSITATAAHRQRFLELLRKYHVTAYICGHTHNCSIAKVAGLWQLDSGHSRGGGDSGSPSTFLKIRVHDQHATVDVYRADVNGLNYHITKTVELQ